MAAPVLQTTPMVAPITLSSLLREAAGQLAAAGIEGPRAEARWLLRRVLGVSESAVKSRTHRARRLLRERLAHPNRLVEET